MHDSPTKQHYAASLKRKNRLWAGVLATAVLGWATFTAFSNVLAPLDRWFYDWALHAAVPLRAQPLAQSNTDKPLLIEINEASLNELGRWPWPRSVHAALIDQLNIAPPKVLGFDIVFAQAEQQSVTSTANDADALLASAINRASFPVLLASIYERMDSQDNGRSKVVRPGPPIDQSAGRLAHIHAPIDPDGAVRRLNLQEGYAGLVPLPYLGFALHTPRAAPRSSAGFAAMSALPELARADNAQDVWQVQRPTQVYPMARTDFDSVSYADVVKGRKPPALWSGRTVLVSTTAAGLGDQYVSPIYKASTIMPGGEIVLALLNTLRLQDQGLPPLRLAEPHWDFALTVAIGLALVLSFRVLSLPMQGMVLTVTLLALGFFTVLGFARTGWFVSPVASVFAAVGVFLFWLLLRLQTVLSAGLAAIGAGQTTQTALGALLATRSAADSPDTLPQSRDPVDAHLLRLASQNEAQLATRNTLTAVLQVLPDAAFVLAPQLDGHSGVWLANEAALRLMQQHLPALHGANPRFLTLMQPFHALLTSDQLVALAGSPFHWNLLLRRNLPTAFLAGVAARSADGARFLVKSQALQSASSAQDAANEPTLLPTQGFVLTLLDLSVSQQLGAQRDASLQFLSHDLRSPPAAILAMLELEASRHGAAAPLLKRIGNEAQRTLDLAEGFVQLARAEQSEIYTFAPYDLNDLAIEAADELWAPAKRRGIRIATQLHADALLVRADRTMLWRAVVNLLSNAVRHSPENTIISITTLASANGAGGASLHIEDTGAGIDGAILSRLFQRFAQGDAATHSPAQGAGLGLAFVKTVLDHHAGHVQAISPCVLEPAPHGTRFELNLPLLPAEAA